MMTFRHALFATAATMSIAIGGMTKAQDNPAADTIVATVNGAEITLGHMIVLKQRLPAQYQQLAPEVLFSGILDQLVQQTLLGEGIEELSLGSRIVLENEERSLRAATEIQKISDAALTAEAIEEAYAATYGQAEPETEYNASHILVETEEEAAALVSELEGGADFAELAREKSTGPSGPNGGQLGWFGKGAMVAPFEEAVIAMEMGTISGPVQTQFGWHVIRLNDTRVKSAPPIEEVRGQIADTLRREAVEAHVAGLMDGAEIDRIEDGSIDPNILNDISLISE